MIRLSQRKGTNLPRGLGDAQVRVAELAHRVGQGVQRPAVIGLAQGRSEPFGPSANDLGCRNTAMVQSVEVAGHGWFSSCDSQLIVLSRPFALADTQCDFFADVSQEK